MGCSVFIDPDKVHCLIRRTGSGTVTIVALQGSDYTTTVSLKAFLPEVAPTSQCLYKVSGVDLVHGEKSLLYDGSDILLGNKVTSIGKDCDLPWKVLNSIFHTRIHLSHVEKQQGNVVLRNHCLMTESFFEVNIDYHFNIGNKYDLNHPFPRLSYLYSLGSGAFGDVKLATFRASKKEFAVKIITRSGFQNDFYQREIQIMRTIKHVIIPLLYFRSTMI